MVREANSGDIPKLLQLARRFHSKTIYADVDLIDAHVIYQIEAWLGDPNTQIFISERGAIGVSISKLFFNRGHAVGNELFFYDERGAGLMDAANAWLLSRGCGELYFVFQGRLTPRRVAAAIRHFTRKGFTLSGIYFSRKTGA